MSNNIEIVPCRFKFPTLDSKSCINKKRLTSRLPVGSSAPSILIDARFSVIVIHFEVCDCLMATLKIQIKQLTTNRLEHLSKICSFDRGFPGQVLVLNSQASCSSFVGGVFLRGYQKP